jgi:hypothetical protein
MTMIQVRQHALQHRHGLARVHGQLVALYYHQLVISQVTIINAVMPILFVHDALAILDAITAQHLCAVTSHAHLHCRQLILLQVIAQAVVHQERSGVKYHKLILVLVAVVVAVATLQQLNYTLAAALLAQV